MMETAPRRHTLDFVLLAAMALYVALDAVLVFSLGHFSFLGLAQFLVTAAIYGLTAVDVYLDSNSWRSYAYAVTAWSLFWTAINLISSRSTPLNAPHLELYALLALELVIVVGIWRRYGPPFE